MTHPPSPVVRFVYFDLGNILYRFDVDRSHRQLARELSVSVSDVYRMMVTEGLADAYERGEVTDQQFATELVGGGVHRQNHPSEPVESSRVDRILDAAGDMFTVIDGMDSVIDRVARQVPIGLLSNTCHAHFRWIERMPDALVQPFANRVLSYQAASMKPAAGIYHRAERLAKANAEVDPPAILFLDDKPENVAAALRRGWQSVVCQGEAEVSKALAKFGL